jgi:integrase
MSKNKITDGLRLMPNGKTWSRAEIINDKRCFFYSNDPQKVWDKRNTAISTANEEKIIADRGPLFETVCDAYKEQVYKMKYGTQRTYLPAVKRAHDRFEGKHMREIEPYMISEFLKSLSGMAHTTVSNHKTILNAIFQLWIDSPTWRGDVNPAKMTSLPRGLKKTKRNPPTEEQVNVVKQHYLDTDALLAVTYLCTGERRGEACGIRIKDIDFENKTISISEAIGFKSNQPYITSTKTLAGVRKIPLLLMLEKALDPMRNLNPNIYILSGTENPLTFSQYDKKWNEFWKKYGFAHKIEKIEKQKKQNGKYYECHIVRWRSDVVAHQFRHEYVCMLCMADVSEEIAIQLVGHANAKMIHEVYMSLKPQMITSAGNKLDAFLKQK